jgi:hypothetical protein
MELPKKQVRDEAEVKERSQAPVTPPVQAKPAVKWEILKEIEQKAFDSRNLRIEIKSYVQQPDGERGRGQPRVTIEIARGRNKMFLSVPEAKQIISLVGDMMPNAELEHSQIEHKIKSDIEHRKQMRRMNDDAKHRTNERKSGLSQYTKGSKTERNRKKGRAGHAAHKQRKAEKSARDREAGRQMKAGTKCKGT